MSFRGGGGTMYMERSMKEKGILVTQSNQKPEGDERMCRATALMSSQYCMSWVWYPTKNCRRTSACGSHKSKLRALVKSVKKTWP